MTTRAEVDHPMPSEPVLRLEVAEELMRAHVDCPQACEAKHYLTAILYWLRAKSDSEFSGG
ncbi:hypothetical protein [Nocardia jejuensis]|uniref:hypothetical protein n=1 Tax=Nocardia jejuensis TaxID=328049 RepID=UPI0009FF21D8|nr:hypothetical protein [Nocardia jejuensis]